MSDSALAEIEEKFGGGTWKLDRSENFEDFLREVGVNVVVRKMAGLAKPTSEITVKDGKVSVSLNAGFMKKCDTFVLGEEFDTEFQGNKAKGKATYGDGVLTMESKALDPNIKATKSVREITADGELLLTIYIGDVICKRWFKKLPP